ncbi:MAG: acyltransferase family protein, partial [Bacteroidota bacterium]
MDEPATSNQQPTFRLTAGQSLLLDFIRGWSAQAVLFGHALYFFNLHGPGAPSTDFFVHRYAVAIFFLLSGFLITYSTVGKLARKADYGFRQYFIDRFARIYTALVPALLFILVVDLVSRSLSPATYAYADAFSARDFLGNLLMLQYFPGLGLLLGERIEAFGSGTTLWTLSIEWWIYLW